MCVNEQNIIKLSFFYGNATLRLLSQLWSYLCLSVQILRQRNWHWFWVEVANATSL
jgi:hypothetical protein